MSLNYKIFTKEGLGSLFAGVDEYYKGQVLIDRDEVKDIIFASLKHSGGLYLPRGYCAYFIKGKYHYITDHNEILRAFERVMTFGNYAIRTRTAAVKHWILDEIVPTMLGEKPHVDNLSNDSNQQQLEVFSNPAFGKVRIVMVEDEPWFVGVDVAEALGYTNPQKAIRDHVNDKHKGVNETLTPGGKQKIIIIDEAGMYRLIFSSKLPKAEEFTEWVTSEVLPTLRKTGEYRTSNANNNFIVEKPIDINYLNEVADMVDVLINRFGLDKETAKTCAIEIKRTNSLDCLIR